MKASKTLGVYASKFTTRALPAVVLAAALTGCGSEGEVRSNTPSVTVDANSPNVSLLLTEEDVRSVHGMGSAEAQDFTDVPVFENPDPRGPCGGVAPQLPTTGAVGRAFTTPTMMSIQIVVDSSDEQRDYVAALQSDRRSDCGPYQSTTNTGDTQTVSEIEFVELTTDLPAIAWTGRVDVAGNTAYIGVLALESSGRLAFIQMQSATPFAGETVRTLADRAADRLNA
jgi:hypothetical protein